MDFLRKFGFFFLLLGVLSDFLTPYVLGLYYPELDQMKSVISVFGEVSRSSWNVSTWVHNIGSGLGYSGFLLFPVLLFLIYRKNGQMDVSHLYLGLSVISLLFAAIYGLARIPSINSWPLLNKIGFCQRISFFFNYVPIAWLSILHLKQ